MSTPDTTVYESPWAQVNRWDPQILAGQNQVYADVGIWVPGNVVKSITEIETGGAWPDPPNYAGYAGVGQVGPGSMGQYDMSKVVSDKSYSMWAEINELALRERDSGFMPWRNVAVGYFSGHYTPIGAHDAYNTDYQYLDQFDSNLSKMTAKSPGSLPDLNVVQLDSPSGGSGSSGSSWTESLAKWAARIALFILGAGLLAAGLWAIKREAA